jgi:DNA (cytosine-5)-methyltransferase 1
VARFDGQPIEFPQPTHGDPESAEVKSGKLLPWVYAAACLEFNHECPSVLMTKRQARAYTKRTGIKLQRPLVKATHRRLAKGVSRHVINAKKVLVVLPSGAAHFISENANASHHRNFSAIEPLRTICAQVKGGHFSLGAVFLAQHNTGMVGHSGREPLSTIVGRGAQQNVVFCSMVKYYGADQDPQMGEPLHTITTKDRFGLVEVQGALPELTPALAVKARRVARWLRANGVKVEGEFAMVGAYVIVDVGMRMLKPRELYRAQGFPESYVIDRCLVETKSGAWIDRPLSGTEQIHMCGNSVSPPVAAALIRANLNTPSFEKLAA